MPVYAQQGDTLDQLCYRHYGDTHSRVEAVLLANPGLADYGVVLPNGLSVFLPSCPMLSSIPTLQLWD